MSTAKKRKSFTAEFKAKVGMESMRGLKTINELAQEFGVHPVQINQWSLLQNPQRIVNFLKKNECE